MAKGKPLPWDPIAEARQNWRDQGWTGAADAMAAVTSIMRVHQILMARIDAALKPHGLSFARFEMLRLLAFSQDKRLAMGRARDLLQVHPASVTNIVDRLELDGLVIRSAHPEDGRSVLIELTEAGRLLAEVATDSLNTQVFEELGMDAEEIATITKVLAGYRQRAGDFAPPTRGPEPF